MESFTLHKMKKKLLLPAAALLLSFVMVTACSHNEQDADEEVRPSIAGSPIASQEGTAAVYPLKTDKTITYWLQSPTTLRASINEVPFYQEWQKQTGVKVKFLEVQTAQAKESFNILLSSGDLPDIIEYNWLKDVPGGPEKALKDGYILPLNDLIDKYAPNLKKYLQNNPDVDKLIKTDEGVYYAFPYIKELGVPTTQWSGPILRKDWLEELGLKIPQTIDEWHSVLTAFKEKKGVSAPLTLANQPKPLQGFLDGAFIGAFGIIRDFYIDDSGKVQYGPLQPGYKDFLAEMNRWYREGLLDKDFTQTDTKARDTNITSGKSGATYTSGGALSNWEFALASKNPAAKFVFVPYPVLKQGDKRRFGQDTWVYNGNASAAIPAKSKNSQLAAQLLDYAYGDDGYLLFNFGIRDQSYILENGKPLFTDLIKKNPEGLSVGEARQLYSHAVKTGPYIQSKSGFQQLSGEDADHDYTKWETDNLKHILPPVTIPQKESGEFARIITDVDTLVDETSLKIILGTEPVESFDSFVKKLESLNIKRAIEIQQLAYDRFKKR